MFFINDEEVCNDIHPSFEGIMIEIRRNIIHGIYMKLVVIMKKILFDFLPQFYRSLLIEGDIS